MRQITLILLLFSNVSFAQKTLTSKEIVLSFISDYLNGTNVQNDFADTLYLNASFETNLGLICITNREKEVTYRYFIPVSYIEEISLEHDELKLHANGFNFKSEILENGKSMSVSETDRMYLPLQKKIAKKEIKKLFKSIKEVAKGYTILDKANLESSISQIVAASVFQLCTFQQVTAEDANNILNASYLFVGKCNICNGTKLGLTSYLRSAPLSTKSSDYFSNLYQVTDKEKQFQALQDFVDAAISEWLQQFSETDQQIIREKMNAERAKSSNMTNGKKCASCDGACSVDKTE